jgi:nicotinate dehydrogenase subunit A
MGASVEFTVNGTARSVAVDTDTSLLFVLRQNLGLTGSHLGCGLNQCGACNVLMDGHVIAACDTPVWSVAGKSITTIEGLGSRDNPHPLQNAFIEEQAAQCGYCLSGILITAAALLKSNPDPDETEIRAALDGNLCRCGAHNRIVRAIQKAASTMQAAGVLT